MAHAFGRPHEHEFSAIRGEIFARLSTQGARRWAAGGTNADLSHFPWNCADGASALALVQHPRESSSEGFPVNLCSSKSIRITFEAEYPDQISSKWPERILKTGKSAGLPSSVRERVWTGPKRHQSYGECSRLLRA